MITSEWLYWLIGAFFIAVAVLIVTDTAHAKRIGNAAFWGILGLSFFAGSFVAAGALPAWILGVAVLVMVALAGLGFTGPPAAPGSRASPARAPERRPVRRNRPA